MQDQIYALFFTDMMAISFNVNSCSLKSDKIQRFEEFELTSALKTSPITRIILNFKAIHTFIRTSIKSAVYNYYRGDIIHDLEDN